MASRALLLQRTPLLRTLQTRSFTSAVAFRKGDLGPDKTHHLDKNDERLDPQTTASNASKTERATGGTQSQATSRTDDRQNNKRAEEQYPESPKPIIGMNEERGVKGH